MHIRIQLLNVSFRAQFYVPGALFIPDGAQHGHTPAVVFTSGHWPLSFRDTELQQIVVLNLVTKVCCDSGLCMHACM